MAKSLNIDISKFVEDSSPGVMAKIEEKYAANVLVQMLTKGLYADVKLQVRGRSSVEAQRGVLAGISSVFHLVFKHAMKEHEYVGFGVRKERITVSTVEIPDMSMEELQIFLVLLYISASVNYIADVSEFEVVAKHSPELIPAIREFEVADRLNYIFARAWRRVLTPDNCWKYCKSTSLQLTTLNKFDFTHILHDEAELWPISQGLLDFVC